MLHWMLMPLRRYAEFGGRSRRKEYWLYILGYVLFVFLVGLAFALTTGFANIDTPDDTPPPLAIAWLALFGIVSLALFIPTLAVQMRRFHDQDRSGWMVLLGLIPYVGGVVILVFMCLPGTIGPNRFGPDPKGGANDLDVFA